MIVPENYQFGYVPPVVTSAYAPASAPAAAQQASTWDSILTAVPSLIKAGGDAYAKLREAKALSKVKPVAPLSVPQAAPAPVVVQGGMSTGVMVAIAAGGAAVLLGLAYLALRK